MEFDENGNIIGGLVHYKISEVKQFLVDNFEASKTREEIFNSFMSFLSLDFISKNFSLISGIMLDGSFCTKKLNPNDIDFVIFIDASIETLEEAVKLRDNLVKPHIRETAKSLKCDPYIVFDTRTIPDEFRWTKGGSDIDYHFKYWLGQFGHDRNYNSKGLIELKYNDRGDLK
ncbi:DUF6932 family protein [Listeria monocytogenes]